MTGQNDSIAVGIPGSHGGGHIFFDGDFDFEGQVKAEVGNAEAADAEDFADQVAAVYNCAQGKGEIGLLLCFIEPADGADRAGFFFGKAAVTDTFGIHSSSHSAAKEIASGRLMQVSTKSVPSMLRMRSVWRNSSPTSQSVETAEELIRRYQVQLDYYAQALERLTGKSVKEKLIYSFARSREIRLW